MKTLSNLKPPKGAVRARIRVGRGTGSGLGKTCGHGQKGQRARSVSGMEAFEGGQMPLRRRLPKRGFRMPFQKVVAAVNVGALAVFPAGSEVNATTLVERGIVKGRFDALKILGNGSLEHALTVVADAFSTSAQEKIQSAGGRAVLATPPAAPEPPAS